jgi:hypothetical protein
MGIYIFTLNKIINVSLAYTDQRLKWSEKTIFEIMTNVSLLRFFKEENTSIVNITRIVLGTKKWKIAFNTGSSGLFTTVLSANLNQGILGDFEKKRQHVGFINIILQHVY